MNDKNNNNQESEKNKNIQNDKNLNNKVGSEIKDNKEYNLDEFTGEEIMTYYPEINDINKKNDDKINNIIKHLNHNDSNIDESIIFASKINDLKEDNNESLIQEIALMENIKISNNNTKEDNFKNDNHKKNSEIEEKIFNPLNPNDNNNNQINNKQNILINPFYSLLKTNSNVDNASEIKKGSEDLNKFNNKVSNINKLNNKNKNNSEHENNSLITNNNNPDYNKEMKYDNPFYLLTKNPNNNNSSELKNDSKNIKLLNNNETDVNKLNNKNKNNSEHENNSLITNNNNPDYNKEMKYDNPFYLLLTKNPDNNNSSKSIYNSKKSFILPSNLHNHPLKIYSFSGELCSLCMTKKICQKGNKCENCSLTICDECSLLINIKYNLCEKHEHSLSLLSKHLLICKFCKVTNMNQLYAFRCEKCNFEICPKCYLSKK